MTLPLVTSTVTVETQPRHGAITQLANPSDLLLKRVFRYMPNPGFTGSETFSLRGTFLVRRALSTLPSPLSANTNSLDPVCSVRRKWRQVHHDHSVRECSASGMGGRRSGCHQTGYARRHRRFVQRPGHLIGCHRPRVSRTETWYSASTSKRTNHVHPARKSLRLGSGQSTFLTIFYSNRKGLLQPIPLNTKYAQRRNAPLVPLLAFLWISRFAQPTTRQK